MGCTNLTKKNINVINKKTSVGTGNSIHTTIDINQPKDDKTRSNSDSEGLVVSRNTIKLEIEASSIDKLYHVWLEKGVKVKFYVKGKWSLINDYGYCDCLGYKSENIFYRDIPIGALVCRVQGGTYFQVTDNMNYISDISGPLYFSANNSFYEIQPTGSLTIYIENANYLKINEIEENLGWKINLLNTATLETYLSPFEIDQIILINKVRSNPKEFAKQYLIHLICEGNTYKEIYHKLQTYPSCKMLQPIKALYNAAKDHAIDLGTNGSTGHLSTNGDDLKVRILKYSNKANYFGENCCFNFQDPLSIILKLLVDEGMQSRSNRYNLLNEGYTQIGISYSEHITYNWVCVQVFGCNIENK